MDTVGFLKQRFSGLFRVKIDIGVVRVVIIFFLIE